MIVQFGPVALAISAALLDSLWEGAFIVAAVWLGLRFLSSVGAATRYAVWLCTLAALVVVPILTVAVSQNRAVPENPPHVFVMTPNVAVAQAQGRAQLPALHNEQPLPATHAMQTVLPQRIAIPENLALIIAFLWLVVAAWRGLLLLANMRELAAIRTSARVWSTAQTYPILISDRVALPLAVGFLRPAILLPASLVDDLTPDAINAVILHETAHLLRFDVWTNAIARFLEALVVLNPAAICVIRQLSREREIACDDWIVARLGTGDVFARTFAALANSAPRRSPLCAPSALGSRHSLVTRIAELLATHPRYLRLSPSTLGGMLMFLVIFALFVESISPVFAYSAAPKPVTFLASTCTTPNRPVMARVLRVVNGKKQGVFVALASLSSKAPANLHGELHEEVVKVTVTVDASGKGKDVRILSGSPNQNPSLRQMLRKNMSMGTYLPALVNCRAVSSTVPITIVLHSMAEHVSVVTPIYPAGWSAQNASSCKVPVLVHGGVPTFPKSVALPTHGTITAAVRVSVDNHGTVTKSVMIKSSGQPAFDEAVLAAARSSSYPLGKQGMFQPVRPGNASLSWNSTHGYSTYANCRPRPTEYQWTTTYGWPNLGFESK